MGSWGLVLVIKRVKFLKNGACVAYFMGLWGFCGGCEGGVWVIWRGGINDLCLRESVSMVFGLRRGLGDFW